MTGTGAYQFRWKKNCLYWRGVRKSVAFIKRMPKDGEKRSHWIYEARWSSGHYWKRGITYTKESAIAMAEDMVVEHITLMINQTHDGRL